MPTLIKMPALSPTMEQGTLSRWIKKENDKVSAGDILCEIETDKATMELEAVDDGILGKILVLDNTENVAVNAPIAILLAAGESMDAAQDLLKDTAPKAVPESTPQTVSNPTPDIPTAPANLGQRIFASPLAKRIAQEKQIDLSMVQGSGPSGRIIRKDVDNHVSTTSTPITGYQSTGQETTKVPLSGMRKTIAKRLTEAKQNIPHFYLTINVQAERLLAVRAVMNDLYKDAKITVNDIIVKACGCALLDIPVINATFHQDVITLYSQPHVCVAVAVDGGLITPTVSYVNQKNIRTISAEVKTLVEKAKTGKLKPEEYQNGTFTISNLGMFGIQHFQAIINPPQVAILAVGAIQNSGAMQLTLSVDHRAVDGADAARFLQKLKLYLEQPEMMLI